MSIYKSQSRITYYDLDFSGNVKLSALLKIVQIAADSHANELGVGIMDTQPLDMGFILQRFGCKIFTMPKYNDNIIVRTWPADMARGTFMRKGDISDLNGNKLIEWSSMWILFNISQRKILKPSALPVDVPTYGKQEVEIEPKKIILPQEIGKSEVAPTDSYIHTVKYADVDTYMHMNNSVYGDLIGNVLFPSLINSAPEYKEIQINYLGETKLNEEIEVSAYRLNNTDYVVGQAPGRISFTAQLVF